MSHVNVGYCSVQIINVYNQEYESAAAFWPDVHGRVIVALVISQMLMMGLLATKHATQSTPFLIALPILTIAFHKYCRGRYEPAFVKYPLQVCFVEPDHQTYYSLSCTIQHIVRCLMLWFTLRRR